MTENRQEETSHTVKAIELTRVEQEEMPKLKTIPMRSKAHCFWSNEAQEQLLSDLLVSSVIFILPLWLHRSPHINAFGAVLQPE